MLYSQNINKQIKSILFQELYVAENSTDVAGTAASNADTQAITNFFINKIFKR